MLVCSIYSRNLLARPFDIKKSSSGTKVRCLTQVVTVVSERDPILTYSLFDYLCIGFSFKYDVISHENSFHNGSYLTSC